MAFSIVPKRGTCWICTGAFMRGTPCDCAASLGQRGVGVKKYSVTALFALRLQPVAIGIDDECRVIGGAVMRAQAWRAGIAAARRPEAAAARIASHADDSERLQRRFVERRGAVEIGDAE